MDDIPEAQKGGEFQRSFGVSQKHCGNSPRTVVQTPVLLVSPWYKPAIGGVAISAERLRAGLRNLGIDVHLFVPGEARRMEHHPHAPPGASVWQMEIPSYVLTRPGIRTLLATLVRAPGAVLRMWRFLRAHGIRRICILYPTAANSIFLLLKPLLGFSLILSFHGGDIRFYRERSFADRWVLRALVRGSDAVIVHSAHMADRLREISPPRSPDPHVIPLGVDLEFFSPVQAKGGQTRRTPTILHVSNFAPVKRTQDIVAAFSRAKLPEGTRLMMVGDGPERENTMACARGFGIDDRVDFPGALLDVRPALHCAEIFFLASEFEGGAPIVLLEAMACGIPWVSTPWGVTQELPPGECGLVVPVGAIQEMANALETLILDPEMRVQMGQSCRRVSVERYGELRYLLRYAGVLVGGADWMDVEKSVLASYVDDS